MRLFPIVLLLLAAPVYSATGWNIFDITVSDLPGTCDPGRIYGVTDGADGTDCSTGSGSTAVLCQCDNAGSSYAAVQAGGGGHGDGANCLAGEIPLGVDASGAVQGCYEPVEADISDLDHTATAITDGLILEADLDADEVAVNDDILTFDSTGSNFSWQTPAELGLSTGSHFSPNADPGVDHSSYVAGHGDGANCLAGQVPLGVDGSGAAQGCYEPAEVDISDLKDYVEDAGDTMTGILTMNDAAGDSPAIFMDTPSTNGWSLTAIDADGNLEIETDSASDEVISVVNIGAGDAGITVSGDITGGNVTSGANPGHTHTTTSISDLVEADVTDLSHFSPTAGIDTDHGAGAIDATTDLAGALCGTSEILEDQGGSWACIATPGGGGYPALSVLKAKGTSTSTCDDTENDITWGTATIDNSSDIGVSSADITISTAGTYLFDVTLRTTNANRTELFIYTYIDPDGGSGYTQDTDEIVSDYVSRDVDQDTGAVNLNTALDLAAGAKVKFAGFGDTDGTCVHRTDGTILRVVRAD